MNWWMLDLPFSTTLNATVYTLTLTTGYILLLMSGIWISRMLKHNLMEDVFNTANESFMQETRLMENEYSVNLPTKFVYQGKGMGRLDQHREPVQSLYRTGNTRLRKELCRSEQLHQTAD